MHPEDLNLQDLNAQVQVDQLYRERLEAVTVRELNVTRADARINAREHASQRREQASKKLVAVGVTLCLVGFGLLYFTLAQEAKRAQLRQQLYLSEMRDLERLRR